MVVETLQWKKTPSRREPRSNTRGAAHQDLKVSDNNSVERETGGNQNGHRSAGWATPVSCMHSSST